MARNGGDVTVESLTALGATHVFGIPGQHALGLFDAIRRSDLSFVSSRVENNSVFAADGYARTTGQVGVVFCSTGPGALTALGALQEAYAACVPVLMITSQIPRDGLGGARKGYLHQLDDQRASARNVTKSTATVRDAAAIPGVLADAWATAQEASAGPVWVEIPQDVLLEEVTAPPVTGLVATVPAPRRPRPEVVVEAARLLTAAERPVILAGGGVRRSAGASGAMVALAELLDSPVVSTSGGNGSIPLAHPLSAGAWIEDRHTTDLLEDADVLLAIGTSFGEVTSNYGTFAPRGRVIQVDAEARVLGSNHDVLGVHADAAAALVALAEEVGPEGRRRADQARSGASVAENLLTRVRTRLDGQELAAEQRLLADLRAAVPDDAETFWDMTIAAYWAWSAWDPRTGGFHTAQASGGLGLSFPAAIGAAVGAGRRTFAVSGDGGAMYSIAELATARQHDAEVTWLVIDDGGYGILREYMTGAFGAATATELTRPDFVLLAEAFGIPVHAATPETVGEIVAGTFTTSGPAVVVLPTTLRMFSAT
ncbi:thiamine pyrophosphate-binding protein [Nocardioides sp. NPDC006273]|uniref:thiamine pyrophosphate-binding protein n=1 Tax=Nocardioides sp. NPDC006273 TaxID=3155598 RepID=UPI00339FFCAC